MEEGRGCLSLGGVSVFALGCVPGFVGNPGRNITEWRVVPCDKRGLGYLAEEMEDKKKGEEKNGLPQAGH